MIDYDGKPKSKTTTMATAVTNCAVACRKGAMMMTKQNTTMKIRTLQMIGGAAAIRLAMRYSKGRVQGLPS